MRSVTWESDDGHTVHMGATGPYYFKNLTDGVGTVAETFRAPRQSGQTTCFTALAARSFSITGAMEVFGNRGFPAQAAFDRAKSALCMALAPHRWGYLTYHTEDGDRRIHCRTVSTPGFGERVGRTTYCTLDIEFTADSSYWESSDLYTAAIGVRMDLWHFPMALPTVFGSLTARASITNPTGEIIYPTVEITSTAQLVTITNVTAGKHISVNRPIGAGEKMIVGMEDASAAIWRRDAGGGWREFEDVSHWLTLDSDPWGLIPGENVISIDNEIPDDTPVTYIKYRLPYLGV